MANEMALAALNMDDPRSLISLAPPAFQEAILNMLDKRRDLAGLDEGTLYKKFSQERVYIPAPASIARMKLWYEYLQAQMRGHKIQAKDIYEHHRADQFYSMIKVPEIMAWMLCPPSEHTEMVDEGLQKSMLEIRAILDLPNVDEKGKPDHRIIDSKLKVYALFDARKFGSFVQRIQQQNLNVTVDAKDTQKKIDEMTQEEIAHQLSMLEKKQLKAEAKKSAEDAIGLVTDQSDTGRATGEA